jgi:hypothetical protein
MNADLETDQLEDRIEHFNSLQAADTARQPIRRRLPALPDDLGRTLELNDRRIADICSRATHEWRRIVIEQPAKANIDFLRAIHLIALINRTIHFRAIRSAAASPDRQTRRLFTEKTDPNAGQIEANSGIQNAQLEQYQQSVEESNANCPL